MSFIIPIARNFLRMKWKPFRNRIPHGKRLDRALTDHLQNRTTSDSHINVAKRSRKKLELRRRKITSDYTAGKISRKDYLTKLDLINGYLGELEEIIHAGL